MNVDYDLYEGETASAARHTYCRGELVYDRGEIRTQPGHGALRAAGRARRWRHEPRRRRGPRPRRPARAARAPRRARRGPPAGLERGSAGCARVVPRQLDELDGITVDRDEAGNVWAELPGDGEGFVIVGSHLDAVPSGGWLDGCLG